jgi:peptide/nickel transport system substrate-binding protein
MAAAGLALVAGTGIALAQAPKKGGILTFAVVAEPPNYDCHANTSFALTHPIAPHYSTLLKLDGDHKSFKYGGDLAKSWEVAPDGLTYTFKIHEGVKFHDGSPLTSADVKASYERIIKPPTGVISIRQQLHEPITAIETPDATTVVFKLSQPDASMLSNFASPFNCIYSAAKLAQNPLYPQTEIMGSGAFTFVKHEKGASWEGKRFDDYFLKDRPYLDGYKALFVKSNAVVPGLIGGQFDAEFRGRSPKERDQVVEAMGAKVTVEEAPWVNSIIMNYNAAKKPFDDVRVRQALNMSIDRWSASAALSKISILGAVGGVMRPGTPFALTTAELEKLPGYQRNMDDARAKAKELLKAAGVEGLKLKLVNRNLAEPYTPVGIYLIDQWKRIGVTVEHVQLETKLWQQAQANGDFDVSIDFIGDIEDEPSSQFVKFLSKKGSANAFSQHTDTKVDEMYAAQARMIDPVKRKAAVNELEKYVLTQSYVGQFLWWQRIITNNVAVKGWKLLPNHYGGQDLVNVWLDK